MARSRGRAPDSDPGWAALAPAAVLPELELIARVAGTKYAGVGYIGRLVGHYGYGGLGTLGAALGTAGIRTLEASMILHHVGC